MNKSPKVVTNNGIVNKTVKLDLENVSEHITSKSITNLSADSDQIAKAKYLVLQLLINN